MMGMLWVGGGAGRRFHEGSIVGYAAYILFSMARV